MGTSRKWCFTWNIGGDKPTSIPESALYACDFSKRVKYCIWQLEMAPSTGQLHYQGYAVFDNAVGHKQAAALLNIEGAHMEPANGDQEDNQRYCGKNDTRIEGPFQHGSPEAVGQGKRSDLVAAAASAADLSKSMVDVILEHPSVAIRYGKGLESYRQAALIKKMRSETATTLRRKVDTFVYWGKTGTGKTTTALKEQDAYWLPPPTATNQPTWFDNYVDQKTLIIDEFVPQCLPLRLLLNITDGSPIQLPKKGGFVQPCWTKVVITTNFHPRVWYPDSPVASLNALSRRLTNVVKCVSPPARFGGDPDDQEVAWNDKDDQVIDLTNE